MVSETVVMQVMTIEYTINGSDPMNGLGARVTADFDLANPEAKAQSIQVGFPLNVPPASANSGGFINLTGLRAFVAGSEVSTTLQTVGADTWSAWQMTFAPGLTHVHVTYDLPATVDRCSAELGYVLHTGAAWAGTIGQADLIVRYPYAAEATFLSPHGLYLGDTTAGSQVAGNDLRWHYDNLEPTKANDLAVTFVTPECWLQVAAARNALNANATAQNYWHLANTYADLVLYGHSFYSPLIAQVADAQFQKALALDPQNPQITSDYAQFLVFLVGYLIPANRQPDEIKQCLAAIMLAPADENVQSTCRPFLEGLAGDSSVLPEVQATVAAALDAEPVVTEQDTATEKPSSPTITPAATVTPAPSASATLQATTSPLPVATTTAVPPATLAATASAALPASPFPTAVPSPFEPTESGPDIAALVIVLAVLLVVGLAVYVGRRRRS